LGSLFFASLAAMLIGAAVYAAGERADRPTVRNVGAFLTLAALTLIVLRLASALMGGLD
jgi:hypothetical protein